MDFSKFMISGILVLGALFVGFDSKAQKGPTLEPKLTEVWEPVPAKVTPGENNAAPSDAIILFDGKDLNEWVNSKGGPAEWIVEEDAMTVKPKTGAIKSKLKFSDFQLHIEWRAPSEIVGEGQGRGNSGIFMMEKYELQVLDSYESKTYSNGQAGSIYKQSIPLVNACKGPGEWQTYDVIFMAPEFTEQGTLKSPARITVLHNGILIQNNFELKGPTEYNRLPKYEAHGKGSITLQDHGNPVSYRNIWIREL
ncbi:MAG: DUF1080 domain-containing protein [Cytophagales bacterium]|nr:DUF1080 domain-containing protein [Cytophagales bacterium]